MLDVEVLEQQANQRAAAKLLSGGSVVAPIDNNSYEGSEEDKFISSLTILQRRQSNNQR